MENASKALLIAGAILIAILLIAIGMMVFNSASGVIDTAASGMTDHQKTMHNKKFTIYEGKQSASVVKEIFDVVDINNKNTENQKVSIYNAATGTTALAETSVTSGMYNVKCETNSNGIVTIMRIYK